MKPGEPLTRAEFCIHRLVIEGLSNEEIAQRLGNSVKTVKGHLTSIYIKAGVQSRAQLIVKHWRSECARLKATR